MSQLLVGAGGWAYFQVPGIASLEAYARAFDFVEVNSSYYELPTVSAASEWRKRVPDKFVFSVRSPRVLVDRYGLKVQSDSRELIRETRRHAGAKAYLVLLAAPRAVDYYPRVGFKAHPSAWILRPEDQLV